MSPTDLTPFRRPLGLRVRAGADRTLSRTAQWATRRAALGPAVVLPLVAAALVVVFAVVVPVALLGDLLRGIDWVLRLPRRRRAARRVRTGIGRRRRP